MIKINTLTKREIEKLIKYRVGITERIFFNELNKLRHKILELDTIVNTKKFSILQRRYIK